MSLPVHFLSEIGFESESAAHLRRAFLCALLGSHNVVGEAAGAFLSCSLATPCIRDGCPVCLRRFREQLLSNASDLGLVNGAWTRASLILDGHSFSPGSLSEVDLPRLSQAVAKRIERSSFSGSIVIGGWDISLNVFGNADAGWNLHLYLLINEPFSERLRSEIRSAFRLSEEAWRPCVVSGVKNGDFWRVLSYSHKAQFSRRSGYFETRIRTDGTRRRNVRDQPLKSSQLLELTSWLAQYSLGSRLILRNVRRKTPPHKELRLRLLRPLLGDD